MKVVAHQCLVRRIGSWLFLTQCDTFFFFCLRARKRFAEPSGRRTCGWLMPTTRRRRWACTPTSWGWTTWETWWVWGRPAASGSHLTMCNTRIHNKSPTISQSSRHRLLQTPFLTCCQRPWQTNMLMYTREGKRLTLICFSSNHGTIIPLVSHFVPHQTRQRLSFKIVFVINRQPNVSHTLTDIRWSPAHSVSVFLA